MMMMMLNRFMGSFTFGTKIMVSDGVFCRVVFVNCVGKITKFSLSKNGDCLEKIMEFSRR